MQEQNDWFHNVETVISDTLRFKAKLAIGEDAYTSLRLKRSATEIWDAAGTAAVAAGLAKSSAVASTFFAPTGLLSIIGIGTATTPIGWVIAAGLVSGGVCVGLSRKIKKSTGSRVTTIPNFINTPIDILALGLFELMAPLALKVAEVDDHIDHSEKELIESYFMDEWGFDKSFIGQGVEFIESKLSEFSIESTATSLAEITKKNPDCNFQAMTQEILSFLREIMEADGRIDKREEIAIEAVESIFKDAAKPSTSKLAERGWTSIKKQAKKVTDKASPLKIPFKSKNR